KHLLCENSENAIEFWDTANGTLERTLGGHALSIGGLACSRDGNFLVYGCRDKIVRLWGMASGKLLHPCHGHDLAVTAVAISPDNKLIASVSEDRTILLWDANTGKEALGKGALGKDKSAHWKGHSAPILTVAFHPNPNEKRLVTGDADGTIKIWDT